VVEGGLAKTSFNRRQNLSFKRSGGSTSQRLALRRERCRSARVEGNRVCPRPRNVIRGACYNHRPCHYIARIRSDTRRIGTEFLEDQIYSPLQIHSAVDKEQTVRIHHSYVCCAFEAGKLYVRSPRAFETKDLIRPQSTNRSGSPV